MNSNDIVSRIGKSGILPVVAINKKEDALNVADALLEGGIDCVEVTFRTDEAVAVITEIAKNRSDMLVGAGTVINKEQVDVAIQCGARFIVSPGFDAEVVDYCISKDIPVFPGVMTPSEVMAAKKRGLSILKFFPAETAGGVGMLKSFAGPFKDILFIPTGGINASNLNEYVNCKNVFACGGTWIAKNQMIEEGKFEKITMLTREAVEKYSEARG